MAHEAQVRYSKLVKEYMEANLVCKTGVVFNNRYEGDPTAGAVKIPVRSKVEVQDYDKANGINGTHGSTSYDTLLIDKDFAINEVIDGYDAKSVPDNMIADRLEQGAYTLAEKVEKISFNILETQGTVSADKTSLTKANIYEKFVDLSVMLDEANVPATGRYAIVRPDVYALLLKDTTNFIRGGNLSQEMLQKGFVGEIAGFSVLKSNLLMKDNTTVVAGKKTTTEIIVGHPQFASRVGEFSVPVHIQDLNGSGKYIGASALQGRQVMGGKVTEPTAIIVKRKEVAA
ncbi:MAG: hypothetical protein ACRDD7_03195 [Peptostreptococcaceae bacterium]